jgi:hypothetical protein
MQEAIASRELICIKADGQELPVIIRVGKPYQVDEVTWGCPVEAAGLYRRLSDAYGADSFQALMLAVWLLRDLVQSFVRDGGTIVSVEGREEVNLERLFSTGV